MLKSIFFFFAISGDPDTYIEAQSEDDIAEQGKTPAVTEGAVRNTEQGIPHTAPSGAKTTSTFRSVVNIVFVVHVSNTRHKIFMERPHVYVYKYEDLAFSCLQLCKSLCDQSKTEFHEKHTMFVLNIKQAGDNVL